MEKPAEPSAKRSSIMAETPENEFNAFLDSWKTDPCDAKKVILAYREQLAATNGVELSYKCRPGVSYSLRARNRAQQLRDFYVMIDVVDDDPENRWLSVVFYADLVTDPDEKGDIAPGGLDGEDAYCFNYDEKEPEMARYIADRIAEGSEAAARPGAK